MHPRAASLIEWLGMTRHPEGGFYRETFRSRETVVPRGRVVERSALTTIYFLLVGGGFSRWHRVLADEAWHFYEGDPLELRWAPDDGSRVVQATLGPISEPADAAPTTPVQVVPAGWWQTARTTGAYTLVGCTVGPGFDFADFQLLADDPMAARRVTARCPGSDAWL
jgi:predicted cupin superfamily sugar epimerase